MRRLSFTNKKVRGLRRRFAWLWSWAKSFDAHYPTLESFSLGYCNWKIPVAFGMVEGKTTSGRMRRQCVLALLEAAAGLAAARPVWAGRHIVVAHISLPDMFMSEVCIYSDPVLYAGQTSPRTDAYEKRERLNTAGPARSWGLALPESFSEVGVRIAETAPNEPDAYRSDWWLYVNGPQEEGSNGSVDPVYA